MHFTKRALIALLSGIGAGTIGFWIAWQSAWAIWNEHPGIGHDAWLLAGIFVPGILVPFAVFRSITLSIGRKL
ncbi:MAG: hypothetical protein HY040_15375 [Planctomycetes bacterium]|nr:hypothetical protein [Planctomycetota bacterium]